MHGVRIIVVLKFLPLEEISAFLECRAPTPRNQLGLGNNTDYNLPQKLDLIHVKKIICGSDYTIALINSNEVYVWGTNYYGQLGLGNNDNRNLPQKLQLKF